MQRVLGLAGLLGAAFVSIGWSLAHFPDAGSKLATVRVSDVAFVDSGTDGAGAGDGAERTGDIEAARSPLDVLAAGGLAARDEVIRPVGRGLEPGVYRVADAEPRIVSSGRGRRQPQRDTDVQPRQDPYEEPAGEVVGRVNGGTDRSLRGEIEPGLYATAFDTRGCSYELTMVNVERDLVVIGEDELPEGRLLATIDEIEPDWFVSSEACEAWYRWEPLPVPLTRAGNGDYWYGDLSRGTWDVPRGCQWESVVAFRGAQLKDVVASGGGPQPLVVDDDTFGVRVRNCIEPMTLRPGQATEDAD